ncbi:MAG: 2OG-Fe(II) oxygenase [Saprospiraceae bacterium]|nr:2OG-Fe(II) oxygenase [Saprospiraceae bacterium]
MDTNNQFIGKNQFTIKPHIVQWNVLNKEHHLKIKRKDHKPKNIYTLSHLLSPTECQSIIKKAHKLGFQEAGLASTQDTYRINNKTRNNKRLIIEDKQFAAVLWQRIAHLVDPKFDNRKVHGLNWRFRIYEYAQGQTFAPHVDTRMSLANPKQKDWLTLFSVMIYLNDNFTGGATTFFDRRKRRSKQLTINRVIRPKTGMGLVFDHLLFHEGSVVDKGIKYAIRSDLIYEK